MDKENKNIHDSIKEPSKEDKKEYNILEEGKTFFDSLMEKNPKYLRA